MRILQIRSEDMDIDTAAAARDALAPGDAVHDRNVQTNWTSILREAASLRQASIHFDAIYAYGASAIRAAGLFPKRLTINHPGLFDPQHIRSRADANASQDQDVIAPPIVSQSRDELRTKLGIPLDLKIIVAPGTSSRDCGHRLAVHAAGLANCVDPKIKLLVWGQGVEAPPIIRLSRAAQSAHLITRPFTSWQELIALADAALYCGMAPIEKLPLRMVRERSMPVVMTSKSQAGSLTFEPGKIRLAEARAPRFIAKAMYQALTSVLPEVRHGDS